MTVALQIGEMHRIVRLRHVIAPSHDPVGQRTESSQQPTSLRPRTEEPEVVAIHQHGPELPERLLHVLEPHEANVTDATASGDVHCSG